MRIFEAREAIAAALEGDVHAHWVGLSQDSRNAWAEDVAYGEKPLDQTVEDFTNWVKALMTSDQGCIMGYQAFAGALLALGVFALSHLAAVAAIFSMGVK